PGVAARWHVASSHPDRHEDVKGAGIRKVPYDRRRRGIDHRELSFLSLDLEGDVQEVTGVEADLQRRSFILNRHLLARAAGLRAGRRENERVDLPRQLAGANVFRGNGGDPVDGSGEGAAIDTHDLVVAGGDYPLVVGEGAVDQLGGKHDRAEGEADARFGQGDLDALFDLVDELAQLVDRL